MSGVFNPAGCSVEFVSAIDPIDMGDRYIPPEVLPIIDCPDRNILPAPTAPIDTNDFFDGINLVYLTWTRRTQTLAVDLDSLFGIGVHLVGLTWDDSTNTLTAGGGGGGDSGTQVLITEPIAPAQWNQAERKYMPEACTFPKWKPHEDEDGTYTYDPEDTISFKSWLQTGVFLSGPCRGKIGLVVGDTLQNADCPEIDIDCEEEEE